MVIIYAKTGTGIFYGHFFSFGPGEKENVRLF